MPSNERTKSRRSDPAVNLLDSALHDGAVVLDAYARFATTLIGMVLFPYAAIAPVERAPRERAAATPAGPPRRGIVQVAIALLVGIVLGRKLLGRTSRTR
jgi:hypothetical protein